jgi:hypothetical protein
MLMFYIWYSAKANPIVTMGDAVVSFLDERDVMTRNMGPLSICDFKKGYTVGATTWTDSRWRWKDATSKMRRAMTLIL